MEFPNLGQHCHERSCKQLDFLPMKCDACQNIFCNDHVVYSSHSCSSAYKKDVQVPVCPLCNTPIPVGKNEVPDIKVGQHIDSDCQSDPAKEKRKAYTNRCSLKGCKQKELVPIVCDACHKNYCLKHRHTTDHNCHGFQDTGQAMSRSGAAAVSRFDVKPKTTAKVSSPQQSYLGGGIGRELNMERQNRTSQANPRQVQGDFTEDEALAAALQASMATGPSPAKPSKSLTPAEQADQALAEAIAASEQSAAQEAHHRQQRKEEKSCAMS